MKTYILKDKKQQPTFKYLVQQEGSQNYYLFNDFDKAHKKMKELFNAYILEPILLKSIFESIGKEWKMKRTFVCRDGKTDYLGIQGDILLYTKFYCDIGECINYELFEKGLN